jgi:hypothetical protein
MPYGQGNMPDVDKEQNLMIRLRAFILNADVWWYC